MNLEKNRSRDKVLIRFMCAVFCLLLVCGVLLGGSTAKASVDANPKNRPPYFQTGWFKESYAEPKAKKCAKNMKSNGLNEAIERIWNPDPGAALGRAIACHEGVGDVGAHEIGKALGEGGHCAFQISPTSGFAQGAKHLGIPVKDYIPTIMRDPAACAKAGLWVYNSLSKRDGGSARGLCNYFGGYHVKEFKQQGFCRMSKEIELTKIYVEAAMIHAKAKVNVETQDNPNEPCYGCQTLTAPGIGKIATLNCNDYSGEFASSLAKARLAYQSALRIGAKSAQDTAQAAIAKNPINEGFGSVKKRYCIGQMHDFLDSLKSLLDGNFVGLIMGFIKGLLEDLLNAACALVVSAINTALEMICLPLPELGLPNFSLPGLDGVSCDGISLADYMRVDRGEDISLTSGGGAMTPVPRGPELYNRIIRKKPDQTLFQF